MVSSTAATAATGSSPPSQPYAPPRLTVFDTGAETCPQGQLPGPAEFTVDEANNAMNPLQYLPGVGMIYRQATGQTIPPPMAIAGSVVSGAIFGGPLGVLGSLVMNFVSELIRLGPDTSRPAVPEGMSQAGSEAGVQPVSPGSITTPGGYTTLATTLPDFLGGASAGTAVADQGTGGPVQLSQASGATDLGRATGLG
jgi:hypothetical protein